MRVWNWVERLYEIVEARQAAPFEYGTQDCGQFAAACVDAITGSAWAAELATQYTDERTAIRFLARSGGLEGAVTARLGDPVPPLAAQRGDVCLVNGLPEPGLGICLGEVVACVNDGGLVMHPLECVVKAWRVS
jgi:hypothetical protein